MKYVYAILLLCVFWLTGKDGYQEFVSEKPTVDPVSAYFKVKTENIGYGKIIKQDEESGVKLPGAKYGIYTDSGCTNKVDTITTGSGYNILPGLKLIFPISITKFLTLYY